MKGEEVISPSKLSMMPEMCGAGGERAMAAPDRKRGREGERMTWREIYLTYPLWVLILVGSALVISTLSIFLSWKSWGFLLP